MTTAASFSGHDRTETGEACAVIHPQRTGDAAARSPEARLDEAVGLARAIDLDVVHAEIVRLDKPAPGTFLGKGTIERVRALIHGEPEEGEEPDEATGARPRRRRGGSGKPQPAVDLVIVNAALTPVQQRNLERAWKCKVIDRTGLILEIFGSRAQTREGRLQVELAALSYQRSRLVRSWTHLERQRGGVGFMGGPGETQIETDRRLIGERITQIRRELKSVERTRGLHRKARRRVPYPVVALVGYTNAGKSTLFNRLTSAEVTAEDQLFATLDPTMRRLALPSGHVVILSDTVGFVSDLPHELVSAFHATLEEVCEADLIVHVRDISHPDTESQRADVIGVLKELGIDADGEDAHILEAINKIDRLSPEEREMLGNRFERGNLPVVFISAATGEGCERLLTRLDDLLGREFALLDVTVGYEDGRTIAWLYEHGEVMDREDTDDGVHVRVRLRPQDAERLRRHDGISVH